MLLNSLPIIGGATLMARTSLHTRGISTSQSTVDHAGHFLLPLPSATESRLKGMPNGPISIFPHKFSFPANFQIKVATVVMQRLLMNGFITTTLLMKLVHPIKHMGMITESVALLKSSARTAFPLKDAGLRRELRFTELTNMERSKEKRT